MVGDMGKNPGQHEPLLTPAALAEAVLLKGDWDLVDDMVPFVANDPDYQVWAKTHLSDEEIDLRDLAATIFGSSSPELGIDEEVRKSLELGMEGDEDPYVRFRSACALAQHGNRDDGVKQTISSGLLDSDTADAAKKYLGLWGNGKDSDA